MIICKYSKTDSAVYVPHLDLLRSFGMAIRRKDLNINFSDGFNPHARLFFTQPLPIGTNSLCEYLCADSPENAAEFMLKINTSLPNGVKILKAAYTKDNPNPANIMFRADYIIKLYEKLPGTVDLSVFNIAESLVISYLSKGETIQKDVKNMVFEIQNTSDKIFLSLACGNVNLRADRLAENLLEKAGQNNSGFDVIKTAVYDKNGKNLDEMFFI